jgi:microcompartment protein CcmK/EutM
MIVGRVTAQVTGSVQHPAYDGRPVFAVRRIRANGRPAGSFLAVDTVGCALGDEVLVARVPGLGRSLFGIDRAPVRSMILGILDAHPS